MKLSMMRGIDILIMHTKNHYVLKTVLIASVSEDMFLNDAVLIIIPPDTFKTP
jgi:hypothetical protein